LEYVLGIDGGGTKTACVISDTEGRLLSSGTGRSSNCLRVGPEEAKQSIQTAIQKGVQNCGVGIPKFKVAYLGMAGAGRPSGVAAIRSIMERLDVADKIVVDTDAAVALAGATACRAGVVLISGTGSIAFGINRNGERRRVGGWGYLLGDEGSGYYIGNRGLVAALRAYDGRGGKTVLLEKFLSRFEVNSVDELIDRVYSGGVKISEISSLSRLIVEAARDGDTVSQKILRGATEELTEAVVTVVRQLKMENDEFELALMGGMFKVEDLIARPVRQNIKRFAARCEVISPRFEPAVGAVLLALKEINVKVNNALLETVKATVRNIQDES
jgi:N-acetylglucosamine kinase-like BadF-type ATPase